MEEEPVVIIDYGLIIAIDNTGEIALFLEGVVANLSKNGLLVTVYEFSRVG